MWSSTPAARQLVKANKMIMVNKALMRGCRGLRSVRARPRTPTATETVEPNGAMLALKMLALKMPGLKMLGLKMPDLKMRSPDHPASEQDRELIACALR